MREQRERILDEYERSGLSGAKFAAVYGVKYQTFATWLQPTGYPGTWPQIEQREDGDKTPAPTLLRVAVSELEGFDLKPGRIQLMPLWHVTCVSCCRKETRPSEKL